MTDNSENTSIVLDILASRIDAHGRVLRNLIATLEQKGALSADEIAAIARPDLWDSLTKRVSTKALAEFTVRLDATRRGEPDPEPDPRK